MGGWFWAWVSRGAYRWRGCVTAVRAAGFSGMCFLFLWAWDLMILGLVTVPRCFCWCSPAGLQHTDGRLQVCHIAKGVELRA
ncbi:hypothetical protein B0I37DRAFT_372755 [Chaetomium sp. MPI-CAGE-AT-0009]|nr:hypothetical protein B0I37DRAFT_372755 [Chaetomium sp. MPI-CAGE-AT-0009]